MEQVKDDWLIRDNANVVKGPYAHHELLQLIKKGEIKGKTEISRANSYWFSLDEKAELYKFFPELGTNPAPPEETQMTMTATLTQAHAEEREELEHTQVGTLAPTENQNTEASQKMEWLSDELAEEFGLALVEAEASENSQTKSIPSATVKADTLPSERKGVATGRIKPFKIGGEKQSAAGSQMVSVPVEHHEAHAQILPQESFVRSTPNKKIIIGAVALVALSVAAFVIYTFMPARIKQEEKNTSAHVSRLAMPAQEAIKKYLLLFDLVGAKEALGELELKKRGDARVPLAQALLKKEFLFDTDGALMTLQTAKAFTSDQRLSSEIENLLGIYGFERDPSVAIASLRKAASDSPSLVFRYNTALALMRNGKAIEATELLSDVPFTGVLGEDLAVLNAWAKDLVAGGKERAVEEAYQKALAINPFSAKARLGLAIHRLRSKSLKDAESDFKLFLELTPDIDVPSQVVNFRKMNDFDIYNIARSQIRELNVPGGVVGNKPSTLIMAVDAVLSCLQNRTGEAGKIVEDALRSSPGDIHILKAAAYYRWKDSRYDDVIDLLKDLGKNSFAVNLLLGKAYAKTGKKELAEKHLLNLTTISPSRSEGWSLLGDLLISSEPAQAKKFFHNALERNSNDLVALRGLDKLGESRPLAADFKDYLPF